MEKIAAYIEEKNETVDFTPFYAYQEFSRKICEWPLVFVKKIDHPILQFLSHNRILAGGAVLDILRNLTPNDYDIFFIKKLPSAFIEKLKKNAYNESINCITVFAGNLTNDGINIQYIKRLYDNPSRVIGGFDLDPCRFFMNHNGEIYGTPTAIWSLAKKKIVINPCCQSENFYFRIMKYQRRKRFKMVHPHIWMNHHLFKNGNDYHKPWNTPEDKVFLLIITGKAHKCTIYNKPITLEALNLTLEFYYTNFGPKWILYHLPETRNRKIKNAKNIPLEVFQELLAEKYEDYKKLTNFLLTNTASQMTASFHPTTYKFSEIYPGIRFDLLKSSSKFDEGSDFDERSNFGKERILRAIFAVIRFGRMPRVIYYKIFAEYYGRVIISLLFPSSFSSSKIIPSSNFDEGNEENEEN